MSNNQKGGLLGELRRLADRPEEQAALALRLVEKERNAEVVLAALAVLAERDDPAVRPVLLARYAWYEASGARRDPGAPVRAATLTALRPVVRGEDIPLLERACMTYEFLYGEAAAELRAAGLLTLHRVDDALAGYHAVRLLPDRHTNIMNGEPALTAARLLAQDRHFLPLYAYLMRDEPAVHAVGDVVGECLRSLTALPATLLPALVERYHESDDEIVLLGLFDLLLAHPSRVAYRPMILAFLRATTRYNLYRYLVAALVAGRDEAMLEELKVLAQGERDARRLEILTTALALRRRTSEP